MVPENTSISKADALAEAYKRGLLPPDKKAAYEEAMKRGLVQPVVTPPKPAPMSQPDATPWGDGQAFDDMYARKPQTDPMNLPLMPGARTLTSGQPTRMKPPPAPRGPVMSPAQRQATQPGRDAAVAKRTEQANRWKTDSPFGTPVDEMGMPIAVTDAQRDGGMYGVRDDVGKGIVASPIHAERAVVGATESILNLPADVYNEVQRANARHVLTPQEEMRNVNRMPQLMGQVGVQKAPPVQVPRFDFSAAKIPVPQELESVSGALGEGLAQFLISRKLVGKVAPGGGLAANTGKDAAAVFVGIDGSTGRMADVIDPNAIPEGPLRDYFNFLKTQPDDSPLLGRFKNFLEDMTVSGPMIVPQTVIAPAARAVGSAINPTLTPTNAGGVAASAGVPRPQPAPGSAVPDPRIGAPPRGSDLPPDQRPSGSRPIPGAWAVADDGAMLPNAQAPTPPYPRPDATQPAAPQQPAAPAAPTVAQTAPQAPTQPQTATAPPVPPTPPNAPAVTAGAAQPVPARSRAEQRADDLLIKKLAADGITMDDVRKIQARLARRGDSGVYETIGEIAALTDKSSGANLRGLQMAGGAAPGPLQEALVGLVNQNTDKLSPRLSRGATRATGQKADNAVATLDELENRLRTEAGPAYDTAYATPVDPQVFANELVPVLNTPSGQKALQSARNNLASVAADLQARAARGASERAMMESQRAQAAVKSIDDFMADPVRGTAIPTTMALDYTKRAFDDVIADAGFGSDTARIVGGTKRNFADSVSQATGGQYGNALGVFEDVKRLEDAFEVGTQALNKKTWELERELAKGRGGSPWTAGEVEALAMGVARNIEDLIEANNQSALTKLLKDKALKNMATALGSQKAADMFEETIRRLGANREWGRRVAGGSDTAMRQAAIRDAGMEGEDAVTRVLDRVETSGNQFSLPGLVNDVAVKPIARTAKDIYQRLRYPGVYDEEVNRALIPLIGKPMTEGNLNEVIRRVEARMAEKGLIPPVQPAAVAAPPPAPRRRPRGPRGNPPGTTSSASATGTGIVAGGVLGAMAPADDENEQFINALFTAAGVGTAAGVAAKLTKGGKPPPANGKGAKPKAPPSAPRSGPPGVKPPPVKMGFGGSRDLPMDEGSRMERARSMGFDVDTPLYHGTALRKMFDEFNGPTYLSTDKNYAKDFAWEIGPDDPFKAHIVEAYARGRFKEIDQKSIELLGYEPDKIAALKREGFDGARSPDGQVLVFDPANLRRKDAKFDPAQEQSSKLLAGMSGNAEAIGAGGGAVLAPDVDGDGDVSFGERAGAALSLGIGGNLLRRASGKTGAPNVRGPDAQGFVPKPPQKPAGGKPPPKGPGTVSRMVAGGAVGALAGGVAGEAEPQTPETAQKIADNDRLIERELGQIADFESALKIFSDGTPKEIQAQLDSEGFDLGPTGIDGSLGEITKAAIRGRKEELNANLKTARDRLAVLEGERDKLKADAAFERTRPTEEQLAFRDYAPLLGGIAGATGAKLLRVGGTTVSKFTAKNAITKADALLNNTPISPPKTVQDRAEIRKRATNVNEFWQRGGSKTKVPFETKRDGTWIARPPKDVMPPSALFPDKFIGRKVGAMDALIGGSAATEAVLAGQNAELIKEKLATAYENLKDDKSEENYARVQELEDQYAQAKGLMMLGIGAGIGTGIGVMTSKYASKRANVPKAEEELAILRDYFANQKKPPPKATAKAKKAPPKPPLPPSRPRRNQRPPKP